MGSLLLRSIPAPTAYPAPELIILCDIKIISRATSYNAIEDYDFRCRTCSGSRCSAQEKKNTSKIVSIQMSLLIKHKRRKVAWQQQLLLKI